MINNTKIEEPVLITGNCKSAESVAICLLLANQAVVMLTDSVLETNENIIRYAKDIELNLGRTLQLNQITITEKLADSARFSLAVALTPEVFSLKTETIQLLETSVSSDTPIAINTESFSLAEIQNYSINPRRIIGVNWVEPAHTTWFLEVISSENNDVELVQDFISLAKSRWNKDPYLVRTGFGIRAKLMCALIREAFFLIENGYVSHEDIDRACRNDAGYYLPFAGNFRYMDLMGTYIYGLVMKDMNPDLSTQQHVPQFFKDKVGNGFTGMESNRGMYEYKDGEVEKWNEVSRTFSYQIRKIMEKYKEVI